MKDLAHDKKAIIKALRTMPIVGSACGKAGVSRATYYRWCEEDPKFKRMAQDAIRIGSRAVNDMVYGKLLKQINADNLPATTFYLSRVHPLFKKKDKLKVDMMHKMADVPPSEIPDEAYKAVRIDLLPKKLRKRVTRKAIGFADLLAGIMHEGSKQIGRDVGTTREEILRETNWADMLKMALHDTDEDSKRFFAAVKKYRNTEP